MFYQHEHIGVPEYIAVEKNNNFSFPPHIHQCFEIIILREGQMDITIDDTLYKLEKGEAVLVFPNQVHALQSVESEHSLCIFSPEIVKAYSTKTLNKLPENNKFALDQNTLTLFDGLSENTSDIFRKGVLYLICAIFDKNTSYKYQDADKQSLLNKMFVFVENHFAEDCTLSTLADTLGYNYAYLSRYFKSVVGFSFNTYVNNYRLSHACYLMKNTSSFIIQCAYDSGFVSLRSFNRNFKQQFHITPKEYRKMQEAGH